MNTTANNIANNPTVNAIPLSALNLPERPAVIIRQDWTGRKMVFLADTQNKAEGTLKVWDVSNGPKGAILEVPMAYYKSTHKIENDEEVKGVIQKFSKEFKVNELIQRQRLFKEQILTAPEPTKEDAPKVSNKEVAEKLIAAMTKAINEVYGVA